MTNKEIYNEFLKTTYIPIYSKPWWLDAICGADNWDVWIYKNKNADPEAAMPYYKEQRGIYNYITKAPLTQNNGIIFKYPSGMKFVARQAMEEKIIDSACEFIESLHLDVYEQQYQTSFDNWLPFFWNHYTAITRYTYIFKDTSDLDLIWNNMTAKQRSIIRKGQKNACFEEDLDYKLFFYEHEKIFKKQGLDSPFPFELWERLYNACRQHNSGKIVTAKNAEGQVTSLIFLIWDEKSMYHLLAGSIPEHQKLDTYSALTWEAIKLASEKGLQYDFEGSVIKRISKAIREFGAKPYPYFRIRKVFNSEIIEKEAMQKIKELNNEQ